MWNRLRFRQGKYWGFFKAILNTKGLLKSGSLSSCKQLVGGSSWNGCIILIFYVCTPELLGEYYWESITERQLRKISVFKILLLVWSLATAATLQCVFGIFLHLCLFCSPVTDLEVFLCIDPLLWWTLQHCKLFHFMGE